MTDPQTRPAFDPAELDRFTGSENWYRHPLARSVLYTDGARYVAESAGAYWLLDEIAFAQMEPAIKAEEFQVWTLTVGENATGVLTCEDGDGREVRRNALDFTDFPAPRITFWFADGVIYLPSEH